jgi:hypothetical protein
MPWWSPHGRDVHGNPTRLEYEAGKGRFEELIAIKRRNKRCSHSEPRKWGDSFFCNYCGIVARPGESLYERMKKSYESNELYERVQKELKQKMLEQKTLELEREIFKRNRLLGR